MDFARSRHFLVLGYDVLGLSATGPNTAVKACLLVGRIVSSSLNAPIMYCTVQCRTVLVLYDIIEISPRVFDAS